MRTAELSYRWRFRLLALLLGGACRDKSGGAPPGDDTAGDTAADTASEAGGPLLLPAPSRMEPGEGSFALDESTRILTGAGTEDVGNLLAEALRTSTGLPLAVAADDGGAGIALVLDPSLDLPAEGYALDVDDAGAVLAASDLAGLFYATQTLRQLLPPQALSAELATGVDWTVPAVHIEDAPRFAYRGLMIDVARHFFGVADIERQIDAMALHKLNRLHLHLTDDQGWRIEIKSWPDLTAIGGSTEVGGGAGGFYTREDYAAIVAYAAARSVTVVPEIDFPGHANAALASYPELNESGEAEPLYTGAGVISTPLWLGSDVTWGFVADVWDELAAITPGSAVHIGGDEAVDVSDEDYASFVGWVQGVVRDDGKVMTGWDEVGAVPLDAPFVAQWWWNLNPTQDAVDQGGEVISSPAGHAYLDMRYDADFPLGQTWAGPVNVQRSYVWDPVPSGVDEASVAGVEAALWTELIESTDDMDLMVWPRLAATAELGWTTEANLDWSSFQARLGWDGARLEALGVAYYQSPEIAWVALGDADR